MPKTIDPATLAGFMLAPGAAELVEAFNGIPPGPLRDSIVQMATATHLTYMGSGIIAAPEPPPTLTRQPAFAPAQEAVARALSGPRRGMIATDDPDVQVVELLLQGVSPADAADQLGMDIRSVYNARKQAKRSGVSLPSTRRGPQIGRAKPAIKGRRGVAFVTRIEDLDPKGINRVETAAADRGIDLEAYMARRKLAVEMALEGRHIRAIMEATKEEKKVLQGWFYQAREAGYNVPYLTDMPGAWSEVPAANVKEPEPPTNVVDIKVNKAKRAEQKTFVTDASEGDVLGSISRGASLMGISAESFLALRRRALAMYAAGERAPDVARQLGLTNKQAINWRDRARTAGKLPPPSELPPRPPVDASKGARTPQNLAARYGMSPEAYDAARLVALQLYKDGRTAREVADELRIPMKKAQNWKTWGAEADKRRAQA